MKAVMLAAGRGSRLSGGNEGQLPKALLSFGGKSLLERHIGILRAQGISGLVLVVGYQKDRLLAALERLGAGDFVTPLHNPFFHEGAVVSLWTARAYLRAGEDILFMDADVLYHPGLIERLLRSDRPNCFLVDRNLETGEDPVKLCVRDGRVVDFGKQVSGRFDLMGEWPGFMRLSPEIAAKLADKCQDFLDTNRAIEPYEPAMRELLLSEPPDTFGYEDITGEPWIEIDFLEDVVRAEESVLPRLPG